MNELKVLIYKLSTNQISSEEFIEVYERILNNEN